MSAPAPAGEPEAAGPLAERLARSLVAARAGDWPAGVTDKAKMCLIDLIGAAFESRALPWSTQARQVALPAAAPSGTSIIGEAALYAPGDAAFANAVMGHGLVREDMHPGSISHLGIVVWPVLLALAQTGRCSGRALLTAAVCGYEMGGCIGRAAMDATVARIHRPTGITGPLAAAAAGAKLLGLDTGAATAALALAANTASGFNQWAHTGGSEMFFHAGFAARNALTAVRLAQAGAFASPSALDGEAGLFAALGKAPDTARMQLFAGAPEILTVYHKPVPACNFAQAASQAAVLVSARGVAPADIARIDVRVPRAGALYPGCDATGPFEHILQAKMSIQYNVAAALLRGEVAEANFTLLRDPMQARLVSAVRLHVDDALTAAYPRQQGAEVEVTLADGASHRARLEDVVPASPDAVQERFRQAAGAVLGPERGARLEECLATLEHAEDAGLLGTLLRPGR